MLLLLWLMGSAGVGTAYTIPRPQLQRLASGGLRIVFTESDPAVQLIAVHYSVNQPLRGVAAGVWNYDIVSKANGRWIHENPRNLLKPGDRLYYWYYILRSGSGYQRTEQSWTVPSGRTQPPATPRPNPSVWTQIAVRPPSNNDPLTPTITTQNGITFKLKGFADTTLVAFHYSINQFLPGVRAGQWNYDILKKQNGMFVHSNPAIHLKPGDKVYYWVYVAGPKGAQQKTEQIWTVQAGGPAKPTVRPTAPPIETRPPHATAPPQQTVPPHSGKETSHEPGHNCPDQQAGLRTLSSGGDVVVGAYQKYAISSSLTLRTLVVKDGGVVVVKDTGAEIELRVRSILISRGGELHVGSETCRYQGRFTITLLGRSGEGPRHAVYGEKHLALGSGGVLELHGQRKLSWTLLDTHIQQGDNNPVVSLADDVSSWHPGDRVVVTSTDHDMEQAEEFTLMSCPGCSKKQIKLQGQAKWLHWGQTVKGVDMRAEVGLLTRNIVIRGETQRSCYGNNWCQFFKHDTFGGHFMVTKGFKNLHVSGVELTNMGQQQVGRYPVHFHMAGDVDAKGGYSRPTYVRELSMHHNHHRCVTIHGTNGLLVKDTVGYDTLGHCYFFEDGAEIRNVLDHNLGLLTRSGTALPSDRNSDMCKKILHNVCCGYVPDINNCNAVSTFWIAHPMNTLINNAAAGAVEVGYWYIFHHEPTGLSKGQLPAFHSSRSAITEFKNNRAHSNKRLGLMIDGGVKSTPSRPGQPQEFLAMWGGIYTPHVDADLSKPREAAVLERYIAFKNGDGTWVRGGEIHFTDCQFADNTYSVTLASGGQYPPDFGSHQEVRNSIFIGESPNRGSNSPGNRNWGPGSDGKMRTHSSVNSHPMFGVRIYDGPMAVYNCHFDNYYKTNMRRSAALGFFLNNPFLMTPYNEIKGLTFGHDTNRVFVSDKGGFFNNADRDGDKTCILHDLDGSTTGVRDSYIVRPDNYLVQTHNCRDKPEWHGRVCSGAHAANLYFRITAGGHHKLSLRRDQFWQHPLTMSGLGGNYLPVVMLAHSYTAHWEGSAPAKLELEPIMFNRGEWVRIGLCYPGSPSFTVYSEIRDWGRLVTRTDYRSTHSVSQVDHGSGNLFHYDAGAGLLFIKVISQEDREYWNFCTRRGCLKLFVNAHGGGGHADCSSRAYPRFATG